MVTIYISETFVEVRRFEKYLKKAKSHKDTSSLWPKFILPFFGLKSFDVLVLNDFLI